MCQRHKIFYRIHSASKGSRDFGFVGPTQAVMTILMHCSDPDLTLDISTECRISAVALGFHPGPTGYRLSCFVILDFSQFCSCCHSLWSTWWTWWNRNSSTNCPWSFHVRYGGPCRNFGSVPRYFYPWQSFCRHIHRAYRPLSRWDREYGRTKQILVVTWWHF